MDETEADDSHRAPADRHDAYAALRLRDFRFFLIGSFLASLSLQMQSVAIGWEIYERTGKALSLGLVGLVQVIPVLILALPAGHLIDRWNRKRVLLCATTLLGAASLGLAWASSQTDSVARLFGCLFLGGMARAFQQPAKASILPHIVSARLFNNAVTWNVGGFHLATVLGPALGGGVIAWTNRAADVYLLDVLCMGVCFLLLIPIVVRPSEPGTEETPWKSLTAGVAFVWNTKSILAAITLDMFAVLLGGATALLPIYAKDILMVGPTGLGCMRAAPAVGAICMSLVLAHRPPLVKAGRALLVSVAGFGVATIVFGLSRSYALSLASLFLTGALDNVSVVIRHTLVQMQTPDSMRGRVSAVNSVFIGASNEFGAFESGTVAEFLGPTLSVVTGGIGTLLVVGVIALVWPELRRYGKLDARPH